VNNAQHEFLQYTAKRWSYPFRFGYLAVEQAGWDILDQKTRHAAAQAMTARTDRVATVLQTTGNWGGNTSTATALSGGKWSAATSTNPYIKLSILSAVNYIIQQVNAALTLSDFKLILNPNAAKTVVTSGEFIDFLKQSPDSLPIFKGDGQWNARYGLPATLYGLEVVVDDTPKVTTYPNAASTTRTFVYSDTVAIIVAKQQAIKGSVGSAFSTLLLFAFEEFSTEVLNDPLNRVYNGRVTENISETLVAPESGYLITAIS
jgi:hypothetical protein